MKIANYNNNYKFKNLQEQTIFTIYNNLYHIQLTDMKVTSNT